MKKLLLAFFAILLLATFAIIAYSRLVEPRWVEVTYHKISGTPLAQALSGLRFVVLADPHVKKYGALEEKIVTKVTALEPDYVVWLGDYIKYRGPYDSAMKLLANTKGKMGTFGILGDAEYSNSRGQCQLCHKPGQWSLRTDLPVRLLRDDTVIIENKGRKAALVGLDPGTYINWSLPKNLFAKTNGLPTLVLSHYPRVFHDLIHYPVDLVLSGDTHGGQVYLPWPLSVFGYHKNDRTFLKGWYEKNDVRMYVSRGLGTSHIPIRFGSRPEIAVIDFVEDAP